MIVKIRSSRRRKRKRKIGFIIWICRDLIIKKYILFKRKKKKKRKGNLEGNDGKQWRHHSLNLQFAITPRFKLQGVRLTTLNIILYLHHSLPQFFSYFFLFPHPVPPHAFLLNIYTSIILFNQIHTTFQFVLKKKNCLFNWSS